MKSATEMQNIYCVFYEQFSCHVCTFTANSYWHLLSKNALPFLLLLL